MLGSEEECRRFLALQEPTIIARQIQNDQEQCQQLRLPTLLALYLPNSKTDLANAIAIALYPETSSYPRAIRMAQYNGMIMVIKSYLHQMKPESKHEPLPTVIDEKGNKKPSKEDFESALDVLDFCMKTSEEGRLNPRTPFAEIVMILQEHAQDIIPKETIEKPSVLPIRGSKQRKCYICQYILLTRHPQYVSLCKPCGEYNLASSALSLPENLNLRGKTALVTGARINLGYHTALRLLRSGAKVIVSTRYPRDAEVRYLAEKDAPAWDSNLKIVGADFRAAGDVFHLVNVVKRCLSEWDENGEGKLDILINNAAQTLTDTLSKEDNAVRQETQLRLEKSGSNDGLLLGENGYAARIRGGVNFSKSIDSASRPLFLDDSTKQYSSVGDHSTSEDSSMFQIQETPSKSSWMQSVSQIPYEDVISAHSVNTFVPLILLRELLPIMGSSNIAKGRNLPSIPAGYIINVSSREGIFESTPNSSSKNGHHVHTNLTKAALNMLTETEAGPAWRTKKIAVNSVDPGYMSAAPEIEKEWKRTLGEELGRCPIGWEDGAGRVLWPIAVGESGKGAVWGRFLKHFGRVEVDVAIGR